MLPYSSIGFPASPDALAEAIRKGFEKYAISPREVAISADLYPKMASLRVDLTGTEINRGVSLPGSGEKTGDVVTVGQLEITGSPLVIEGAPLKFQLLGSEVVLAAEVSSEGDGVLIPKTAANGTLSLEVAQDDLQAVFTRLIGEAAKSKGVDVLDPKLTLTSTGARSFRFQADATAKMFMMKAPLSLTGQVAVDEALNLQLSHLELDGSGMALKLVKGFAAPYFARIEGVPIPLTALPLGEIQLRDLKVEVGETVRIEAIF